MSRADVFKLIGGRTEEPVVHELLGVCGMGVDYEYLELTFDAAGKLTDICRVQG